MLIHPDATKGLEDAKSVFGSSNVAIMSNFEGTLDDPQYEDAKLSFLEEKLESYVPWFRH